MSRQIGRVGYLGLAIESSKGDPEASPTVYLNLTDAPKINDKHEVLPDVSGHSSRIERVGSVKGKQWAEGSIPVNLDMVKAGYLFKLALGQEINDGAGLHTFYPTVSGNAVTSATLFQNKGGNLFEYFPFAVCEQLTLTAVDNLIQLQADIKSKIGVNESERTPTTTSGKALGFTNYTAKFGTNIADAENNSATPLNSFNLVIANNIELHHQSGSQAFTDATLKQVKVTGSFVKFFDDAEQRNNFVNLSKQAIVIDITVAGSPETIKINLPKLVLDDYSPEADNDTIYMETGSFEAELDTSQMEHFLTIIMSNGKTTAY